MKKLILPLLIFSSTLSAAVVSTNADSGAGSLREAMTNATSGESITFAAGLAGDTITLASALPLIQLDLTIDGAAAAGLTIDGANGSRIFFVMHDNDVSISNLNLINGLATGGAGGTGEGGGGGGLGAAGALFVDEMANVTIENVTFTNNDATGGAGGAQDVANRAGGGGGGITGSGGNTGLHGGDSAGGGGGAFADGGDGDFAGGGGGGFGAGGAGSSVAGTVPGGGGGGGPGAAAGGAGADNASAAGGGTAGTGPGGTGGNGSSGGGGGGGGGGAPNAGNGGNGSDDGGAGGGGGDGNNPAGNGGDGGNGGYAGGGGGGGIGSTVGIGNAGDGGTGGDLAGGGGGGANGNGTGDSGIGGAGGFGAGGGGAGATAGTGGSGGFGAGDGGNSAGVRGGGGGDALGGAILVRPSGTLTLCNAGLSGSDVTAGLGASGGADGSVDGEGIFIMDGVNLGLKVDAGTFTIADGIGSNGLDDGITKTGAGTQRLEGVNTYVGNTQIDAGILQVDADTALGGATSELIFDGGTLQFGAGFTTPRAVTLQAGGGTVDTQAFTSALSGDIGGAGSLTKIGSGTLTLSGTNTYSGGTNFNGGVVEATVAGNLGTGPLAFDTGTLRYLGGFDLIQAVTLNVGGGTLDTNTFDTILSGDVDGVGGLTKDSTGMATLEGALTYTGDTLVNAGNLTIDTTTNQSTLTGDITGAGTFTKAGTGTLTLEGLSNFNIATTISGGTLEFDTDGTDLNVTSTFAGAGILEKTGMGRLTLSGANTYSGGTNFNGGVVEATVAGNLGTGPLAFDTGTLRYLGGFDLTQAVTLNAGGGTLDTNTFDTILSGDVDGVGGLTKIGTGMATLEGELTYTGNTLVSAGNLTIDTTAQPSTLTGDITGAGTFTKAGTDILTLEGLSNFDIATTISGGTLEFDTNGTDLSVSSTFAGAGMLSKNGAGTLSITGNSPAFAGSTSVDAGTLNVPGILGGALAVQAGAFLTGAGTVGDLTVFGTVDPGSLTDPLDANSLVFEPGSTYAVMIDGIGQSTLINVALGAQLNGGTVAVVGECQVGLDYLIVEAAGGVGGTFDGAMIDCPLLTPELTYLPTQVLLALALDPEAILPFATTPNKRAVALVIADTEDNATGDYADVINALVNSTGPQITEALCSLAGSQYPTMAILNTEGHALYGQVLTRRLSECACGCHGVWVRPYGVFGNLKGDFNAKGGDFCLGGVAVGGDIWLKDYLLVGISGNWAETEAHFGQGGEGHIRVFDFAGYSTFNRGCLTIDSVFSYAYLDNELDRPVEVNTIHRSARSDWDGNRFAAFAQASYCAACGLQPVASIQYTGVWQQRFQEDGADSIDLSGKFDTINSIRSQVGGSYCRTFACITLEGRARWEHEFVDCKAGFTALLDGAPLNPFHITGAPIGCDSALLGIGARTPVFCSGCLFVDYDVRLNAQSTMHNIGAGLRFNW